MWPLFWCLEPECQALLIQFQWDVYGLRLEIPVPPKTSKAVWQAVQSDNEEEIDKLMRQPPKHKKRVA